MFFERFQCCRFRVVGHLKVWEFSKVNVEGLRVLAPRSIWTARQHWGGFSNINSGIVIFIVIVSIVIIIDIVIGGRIVYLESTCPVDGVERKDRR